MAHGEHAYAARLVWDGNTGRGTSGYSAYGREHRVLIDGKPELALTADPSFRGDPHRHNPEDLLLAALSSCHMLSYLALCARQGVSVVAYQDDARGTLRLDAGGGGRFTEVTLRPQVVIAADGDVALATALHDRAHALCFIASSCGFPVHHQPSVRTAGGDR